MPLYVIYNKGTGKIVARTSIHDIAHYKVPEGFEALLGDGFGDSNYVSGGVIMNRPDHQIKLMQQDQAVTLINIGPGTKVRWEGTTTGELVQDRTDALMELTFPKDGTFTIFVEQFPNKPFDAIIKT